ncbi:MAG: hypothetical protein P1V36_02405 [Planctomycetota bacterium]|nr:hypothetical protein [Planctomycetota bacterium]
MRSQARFTALGALLGLALLCMPACGGGGGGVGEAGSVSNAPVVFDGPVYQVFTAFDGLVGAAVDIYTYETLGQGPRHIVPTVDDGSFGVPRYLVTPDTLIVVRVRGGVGTSPDGPDQANQGAFYGLFRPEQIEAETATVSLATTAIYLRLRHLLATSSPVADVIVQLEQRARCLLTDDVDGNEVEDSADVAADQTGAVDAMIAAADAEVALRQIFAGDPIPYHELLRATEPKLPQLMGINTTTAPGVQVARSLGVDEYAYVAAPSGVLIYHYYPPISDEPRHVGTLRTNDDARDMAVKDGVLYALTFRGIESFDISDPIEPRTLDALQLTPDAQGEQITIAGDIAYLAMASEGIRMVDISDPENLTEVGAPFHAPCHSVSARGGTLFAAGDPAGTQSYAFDLSNPLAPTPGVGGSHTGSIMSVVATGPQSAQVVSIGHLGHLDVRDNNATKLTGEFTLQSQNWSPDARMYGDFIVVTHWDGTVECIDIHDPWDPVSIGSITTPPVDEMGRIGRADAAAVTTHGLIVFQPEQVSAYSLDLLQRPEPILSRTFVNNGSAAKRTLFDGDLCYLSTFRGIQVYDVVDPRAPVARGINEAGTADHLERIGTKLYTGSSFGNMQIYDVSDPDAPTHVGSMPGRHRSLHARGDRIYTALNQEFAILDLSDPLAPQVLGTYGMTVPGDVALFGDLAYVADRYSGGYTRVIDISDPANLTQTTAIGPRPLGGRPGLLAEMPNDMLLIGGFNLNDLIGGRLEVVDVSDPANPVVTGHELTSGFRHSSLTVAHGFAYVATGGPICVIDVRDPRQPWWIGRIPMPRQTGVDVNATCGAAGVDDWGFVTFRAARRQVP